MKKVLAVVAAAGLLAVGMAGCVNEDKKIDSEAEGSFVTMEALAGTWDLAGGSFEGAEIDPEISETPVYREIAGDGVCPGSSGCNQIFGQFTVDEGAIEIGEFGQTRIACVDDVMETESLYTQALESATTATIYNDTLVLSSDGSGLNYAKSDRS